MKNIIIDVFCYGFCRKGRIVLKIINLNKLQHL
jgi:hypothetical protein